jgi:hypothetical protein
MSHANGALACQVRAGNAPRDFGAPGEVVLRPLVSVEHLEKDAARVLVVLVRRGHGFRFLNATREPTIPQIAEIAPTLPEFYSQHGVD